jgi:hypothetical protein
MNRQNFASLTAGMTIAAPLAKVPKLVWLANVFQVVRLMLALQVLIVDLMDNAWATFVCPTLTLLQLVTGIPVEQTLSVSLPQH